MLEIGAGNEGNQLKIKDLPCELDTQSRWECTKIFIYKNNSFISTSLPRIGACLQLI